MSSISNQRFTRITDCTRWPSKRARFLFRESRQRASDGDEALTASQSHGVISQKKYMELSGNRVTLALAGTDSFLHVDRDDFVISLRTFEGGIERAYDTGCISPAYTVMKPSSEVLTPYYHYLLKSHSFISGLQTTVTGIRDGKTVRFDNFADLILPVPSHKDQRAIADFLDRETSRIDQLIEKKQRLITLIADKQSIELESILYPSTPPENWTFSRLKYLAKKITKGTTPSTIGEELAPEGIRFLRAENIWDGVVKKTPALYISEETNRLMKRSILEESDILVVIAGATTGKVGLISSDALPANTNQAISFIRLWKPIRAKVIAAALQTKHVQREILLTSVQSAQPNLAMEDLGNLKVPLPPEDKLLEIEASITKIISRFNILKDKIEVSIKNLREFRSALITAAVTGQIDVNEWSRRGHSDAKLDAIAKEMEA